MFGLKIENEKRIIARIIRLCRFTFSMATIVNTMLSITDLPKATKIKTNLKSFFSFPTGAKG